MGQNISDLIDFDKPSAPNPLIRQKCEDCDIFTDKYSIAWPKENFYRYICEVCRERRKNEQRLRNEQMDYGDFESLFVKTNSNVAPGF